jgi:hypothetical protein
VVGVGIFQFVTALDWYSNVSVDYRIMLIIPLTIASAEKSFFKKKLLQICLRLSMLQDRLNVHVVLKKVSPER